MHKIDWSILKRPATWTAIYRVSVVFLLACIAVKLWGQWTVDEVMWVGDVESVDRVYQGGDVKVYNPDHRGSGTQPLEVKIVR